MEMTYTLVADGEADLATGKLSVNSPIGKGLLGKVCWRCSRNTMCLVVSLNLKLWKFLDRIIV